MKEAPQFSRRTFLKGAVATGALAGLGSSFFDFQFNGLTVNASTNKKTHIFQNACPRNCYDNCSILTTVEDGVIKHIQGNPANTYTNGVICVKGNSYPRSVYSPDRIKYPMRQKGRGTGKWERISWDEAYTEIAKNILKIKKEYGSTLPICLNKYSGNFNVLSDAVNGMMASIGYTTSALGTPCWPAGIDAQTFDFGTLLNNDPESFVNSKYIILWGGNPAWTSVHSMRFIEKAKENGCKIVSIDPILTNTAAKAHEHIQIRTSTDGALALGMARYIIENNLYDIDWLTKNAIGYQEFFNYIKNNITLQWASEKTGLPVSLIERIAREYATTKPANIWIGYGMQRHTNGGQNVRAIDALAAITGNVGILGGGANYGNLDTYGFNYAVDAQKTPEGSGGGKNRTINMNNFGAEVLAAKEPPIKMLWIACRNPMQQDPDTKTVKKAFEAMDFVVTADLFMNKSVEMSDIVLPVTTLFETPGACVSYWHYWLTLNEQAIEPMYEAKSDLEIAMGLSKKLNELEKGSCTFPTSGKLEDWLANEFGDKYLAKYGMKDWKELKTGPKKMKNMEVAWKDGNFRTPSGKYELWSEEAAKFGHPQLPVYIEESKATKQYPYRCITPHWKLSLHSQFQNLDWERAIHDKPYVEIHPKLAKQFGIQNDDRVKVYNEIGEVTVLATLTETVPVNEIVIYETWYKDINFNVNYTVKATPSDMGKKATGNAGLAFHDNFVNIEKM